jgi:integrase
MKKDGLADGTIKSRIYRLKRLLKLGANLDNPESVEIILATSDWTNGNKRIFIDSYKAYTTFKGLKWKKPKCIVPNEEPFLPTDEETTQLISGCSKRVSTLLQLLKETGARIGEIALLEWTDLDFKAKTIRINRPEKNSNARTLKLSDKMIAMLNALPKRKDNKLFNPRVKTLQTTFARQRRRITERLQNPRLKEIHFHTFRHYKATKLYYQTGDIMRVKYVLGHKRLDTTDKYTHYQEFRNEEYTVRTARNIEEALKLIESGFKYVTEMDGLKLFRKRK